MLRVSKNHKSTLLIDGNPVKLVIKKLTLDEFSAFAHEFERLGKLHNAEQLELRPRGADEEGLDAEKIAAKRYAAMSPEERARYEQAERDDTARGNQFALESIRNYVTAEPGQIWDEDENRELTSGEDLVRHFGARPDVLRDLVGEIFLMNRLSDTDKKKLLLLRASMRSSSATAAAAGSGPAPTAANADSSGSATSAHVTEEHDSSPSGSTGP